MSDATVGPEPAAGGPRLPRWAKWTLAASLGLNLLLAGNIIGHRLQVRGGPFSSMHVAAEDAADYVRRLDPERRRALRAVFEARRGAFREQWQGVRAAREEAERVLAVEPFEKDRFIAALAAYQDAEAKARAATRPMVAELAAALTPEERRHFLRFQGQLRRHLMSPGERRQRPSQ